MGRNVNLSLKGVAGVGCGEAKWKRSMAAVACWVGSDWAGLGKVGLGWVALGVNQVGPEAVAPLCVAVAACEMWCVRRGISGRAAVGDAMQMFSGWVGLGWVGLGRLGVG